MGQVRFGHIVWIGILRFDERSRSRVFGLGAARSIQIRSRATSIPLALNPITLTGRVQSLADSNEGQGDLNCDRHGQHY